MLERVLEIINTQKNSQNSQNQEKERMARQDYCVDGKLDDTNYSSPMPVIGFYIAGATLVCFLFVSFDIISGFRNKKQWLPCRFFSLNSITLTLLSIAAKIPVDLTTKMPSPQDQLSKLTGTTLICISMGFLMPSLGINRPSECTTDMAAMTVLVVTVIVNICVQLHTGVIILFRVEHIIILCCMSLLLLVLLCCAYDINSQKGVSVNQNKDLLTKGEGSMLKRLKLCYLYAYDSNPQLELCKDIDDALVGILSIVSLIVLGQAAFRSLVLKELTLCSGSMSDYKWSIWIIIVTQIATSLIASFGSSFRWLALAHHMKRKTMGINWPKKDVDDVSLYNPLLFGGFRGNSIIIVMYAMNTIVVTVELLVFKPFFIVCKIGKNLITQYPTMSRTTNACCISICRPRNRDSEDIREFQDLIHEGEKGLEEWILRKGVEEMRKWMDVNNNTAANHLHQLLSQTFSSSQEPLIDRLRDLNRSYEVSSLSVVLLVRIAIVSTPPAFHAPLKSILSEVFEVIHFVERKMYATSFENKKKSKLAKAALAGQNFNYDIFKFIVKYRNGALLNVPILEQAIGVIGILQEAISSDDLVGDEVGIITNFIKDHNTHGSIEELCGCIEQLFVEMLTEFLVQLPNAIFKEIIERNPEDFEETIRFALKVLSKVESIEAFVQWSYPVGTSITELITTSTTIVAIDESSASLESNVSTPNAPDSIEDSTQDEIIQVE